MLSATDYEFKNGDIIKFDLRNGVSGTGEVVGISSAGVTLLGVGYIIRVVECTGGVVIPNETYPYTHAVCFDVYIIRD